MKREISEVVLAAIEKARRENTVEAYLDAAKALEDGSFSFAYSAGWLAGIRGTEELVMDIIDGLTLPTEKEDC